MRMRILMRLENSLANFSHQIKQKTGEPTERTKPAICFRPCSSFWNPQEIGLVFFGGARGWVWMWINSAPPSREKVAVEMGPLKRCSRLQILIFSALSWASLCFSLPSWKIERKKVKTPRERLRLPWTGKSCFVSRALVKAIFGALKCLQK